MNYVNHCVKNIARLLVFTISIFGLSQTANLNNTDLKVFYRLDYKKFVEADNVGSESTVLIIKDQKSLFTFEKMMDLDSIQQSRSLDPSDVLLYRVPYFFVIKNDGRSTSHFEMIGNDVLKFDESINHKWNLVNEQKIIANHKCKKATLNYAGRDWVAWYATEIPVASGSYKFYGLPGLIFNIKDTEGIYEFTINEIKTGNFNINSKVNNYFVAEENIKFQDIKKDEFYNIRKKFYEMTLNQRLSYMNRENGGVVDVLITDVNGEKINTNRKIKIRNFIER